MEDIHFPAKIPISPNVSVATAERALFHFSRNTILYILAYDPRVADHLNEMLPNARSIK
jgi:hypothetical protein